MDGSWWKERSELVPEQEDFIKLPIDGKYSLIGPPGSGKTNLLLLRAKFTRATGLKNILFLTVTRSLADFIKTGVGGKSYIDPDQVMTFRRWAASHIRTFSPELMAEYPARGTKYEDGRLPLLNLLEKANSKVPIATVYDAIFVDEVQDLLLSELKVLSDLTKNLTVGGDNRQAIYHGDCLEKELEGFQTINLKFHYRIGRNICAVADRIFPPKTEELSLSKYSQYDEKKYASTARLVSCATRDEQFESIVKTIETQLRAFPGQGIGIVAPRRDDLAELQTKFVARGMENQVAFHDKDEFDHSFQCNKLIHALTIHAAKGVEFRALHVYGSEKLTFPLHERKLIFTAFTRSKTSLLVYYSGKVNAPIESAFSILQAPNIEDLF